MEGFVESDARALCERLRGRARPLTPGVVATARAHRLHRVLAATMTAAERADPGTASLWRDLQASAAIEAANEPMLRRTIVALASGGVNALLIKGVALGYTVYAAPHLRPRTDIDILVAPSSLDAAERVLEDDGWTRPPERDATVSAFQRHYVRAGAAGATLHLDLHWAIANPLVFARALKFSEVWDRAAPVPPLGSAARIPSPADALLIACMHRVAHHDDELQLLWVWDIHLLVSRMSPPERDQLVSIAGAALMAAVCARGLELAVDWCDTTSGDLIPRLREAAAARHEPSARFVGGLPRAAALGTDFAAVASWRDRAAILREHLFPPAAYVRTLYPRWPPALLPLAYLHRIVRGAPDWFRRPRP